MAERPVRFLVTCPARTGSTMLMWFLQSHRDVCAHGEVLAPNGPLDFYGINYRLQPPLESVLMAIRDRDPVAFLRGFVWQAGDRAAAGFKGKYEELLLPRYATLLNAIRRDTEVRVVHLTRGNLLARFLSQHLATEVYGVFNVVDDRERPPEVRVRLSASECEEDFRRTEMRQERFREWLAGHHVLELTYERLVGAQAEALGEIQEFLGVERRELTTRSTRIRTRSLRESIENYDELFAHFRGGPYERFFED